MSGLGLTEREENLIRRVLERHPEVFGAKIFGSRAKGIARPNSDVDLALWGNLSRPLLATIAGELDELPLPYFFDIQDQGEIRHAPLRDHIERVGKVIYLSSHRETLPQS